MSDRHEKEQAAARSSDDMPSEPGKGPAVEYKVGYKRPPVEHRFRKGNKIRRKGGPKPPMTLQEAFAKVLSEKVTITTGDEQVRMTKARAIAERLFANAHTGDRRARRTMRTLWSSLDRRKADENGKPTSPFVYPPDPKWDEFKAKKAARLAEEAAKAAKDEGGDKD